MVYAPHPASMDAVFGILLNNPLLQTLDLSVQALQNSVLPQVETLVLPELTALSLEGAPHFISLLQHLKLEKLRTVNIRFDVPQSLDFGESFRELLERSNFPPVTNLTIQQPYRMQQTNLSYLEYLSELEELSVSRLPMEDVLVALDGNGSMPCPNLTRMSLSNCPGRRDLDSLVPTLVKFVDKRTDISVSGIKKELQSLKISNCGCTVSAQQEAWLKSKLNEFAVDDSCAAGYPDWDMYN